MKLTFSAEDERFRDEVASWLNEALTGEFACLKFRGGPGDEHSFPKNASAGSASLLKVVGLASVGPRNMAAAAVPLNSR